MEDAPINCSICSCLCDIEGMCLRNCNSEEIMMIQTRSETNGIKEFPTLREAFEAAEKDETIWKISFAGGDERIRLIRGIGWKYEPLPIHELETIEAERFYNLGFEIDPQKE